MKNVKNLIISILAVITIAFTGLAVVSMTEQNFKNVDAVSFSKRLDDFGNNAESTSKWNLFAPKKEKKIEKKIAYSAPKKEVISKNEPKEIEKEASAFSNVENLTVYLTSVYNPKYKNQKIGNNFEGTLNIVNGDIESMDVALPSGAFISVAYSSLTGNTFKYSLEGEELVGAIFKTKDSFVVSLTGGPYDQTRLKFENKLEDDHVREIASFDNESNIESEKNIETEEVQESEKTEAVSENNEVEKHDYSDEEITQKVEEEGFNFSA